MIVVIMDSKTVFTFLCIYCMKIMVLKFSRACFLSAVPVLTDLYLMGWVDSLSQQVLYIHLGVSVSVVECYVVDHELFFG